jgi:hypothetical protein
MSSMHRSANLITSLGAGFLFGPASFFYSRGHQVLFGIPIHWIILVGFIQLTSWVLKCVCMCV